MRDLAFQRTVTPSLPAVSRTDAHRIVYGCFERRLEAVLSVCVMSPFLLGRTLLIDTESETPDRHGHWTRTTHETETERERQESRDRYGMQGFIPDRKRTRTLMRP